MPETLRVGVVGAGIGAGHVAGFQHVPNVEVVAVCGRTPTRLNDLAKRYKIAQRYTNYEAMLREGGLDVVVVATPNNLHYPMTLMALQAGAHVMCEKPLALTVAHAREMAERADQSNLKHLVSFTWRFLPAAAYMKEIIQSGFLGDLYHANVRYFNCGWGDPQGPMRWQFDKLQAGGGALVNIGSHAIHLIEWWLGEFRRVCAMLTTVVKERVRPHESDPIPIEVEDACAFLAELADGTPVVFDASSVALVQRNHLDIGVFGSDGSLIFQDDWGTSDAPTGKILALRKGDIAQTIVSIPGRLTGEFLDMPDHYSPFRACFSKMASELVNAIREDRPASPNFHDGARVQKVIDAVQHSTNAQRWVTVQD